MGVWIETLVVKDYPVNGKSHPVWVCGLKRTIGGAAVLRDHVTPCMGVWIETSSALRASAERTVTPCMGVWIET